MVQIHLPPTKWFQRVEPISTTGSVTLNPLPVDLQTVLTSEEYDFYMETNFKWPSSLLVAVAIMLVAHAMLGKLFAQSERPNTTQNALLGRLTETMTGRARRRDYKPPILGALVTLCPLSFVDSANLKQKNPIRWTVGI